MFQSPVVGFPYGLVAGSQDQPRLASCQWFFGDGPCGLRFGAVWHLVFLGEGRPLNIVPQDWFPVDPDLESDFPAVVIGDLLAELIGKYILGLSCLLSGLPLFLKSRKAYFSPEASEYLYSDMRRTTIRAVAFQCECFTKQWFERFFFCGLFPDPVEFVGFVAGTDFLEVTELGAEGLYVERAVFYGGGEEFAEFGEVFRNGIRELLGDVWVGHGISFSKTG